MTEAQYLGVVAPLAASLAGGVDPLVLVGGAGARPRGGVELLVSDVIARVAGVCLTVAPPPEKQGGKTARARASRGVSITGVPGGTVLLGLFSGERAPETRTSIEG